MKPFAGIVLCFAIGFLLLHAKAGHCFESDYAAAGIKGIRLLDENASFFELGFGVMTGEHFAVGGRVSVLKNAVVDSEGTQQKRINVMTYAGARLEYILPVYQRVNVTLGTLAGFGFGEVHEQDFDLISTGFFGGPVIEPHLGIMIRLLPHLDLGIEGSYFYMLDGIGLSNGVAGNVTLRAHW